MHHRALDRRSASSGHCPESRRLRARRLVLAASERGGTRSRSALRSRKWRAIGRISSRRSRSGGTSIREHAQAIEEVTPEAAGLDLGFERTGWSRRSPHVDLPSPVVAHGLEGALLEDAQELALELERDLPYLVEEQRAAVSRARSAPAGRAPRR